MYNKDDEDWFDILRGQTVPDADPKTVAEAEMLRHVLLAGKERKKLPPLRLPESVKETKSQRVSKLPLSTWQGLSPAWTSAIAFSAVAILLVTLFIPIYWPINNESVEQSSGEISKDISSDVDYLGEIIILHPQEMKIFYKNIEEIVGKERIIQKQTNDTLWKLTFQWQPEQVEALNRILAPYHIDINAFVEAGFTAGYLYLELKSENTKTTPLLFEQVEDE